MVSSKRSPRKNAKLVLLDRVLEAKDMALKLRHIHDALQGEVKQKTKRLIDIKRGVEERNSQVWWAFVATLAILEEESSPERSA